MRKFLKITAIILLLLIIALFSAPFLFKGKIIALIKTEINKNIDAKADFSAVDISLFRKFPRVSVAIEQLQIIGNGDFAADTLLAVKDLDVALDLLSVIRGNNMKIYSIEINQPRIRAIAPKTGKPNWDIMKADTSAGAPGEEKPFHLELKKYAINDAYISYLDAAGGMSAEIFHLDHEGSGDFNADLFTLKTKSTADAVNYTYGAIPYLVNVKTSVDADIQVDNKTSKYTFNTEEIRLNELKLAAKGFFQLPNDSSYTMDISFNAPATDFKNILSLIPVVYQKDFDKVKTSGEAVFNGFVKGTMSGDRLPAYTVNLNVKDGFFQYPDLPAPVKNINLSLKVENPDGITDHTIVNIPAAHFEMENDPFDLRLLLKTPVSNMWVDAAAKGKLDLSKVSRMVKLEQGTRLSGLLNADVSIKGFVEAIQKQQFDQFSAAGTIQLTGFSYAAKDYPDGVELNKLLMTFNPKNVTLNEASGRYLNTGFAANGSINNLLGYTLKNRPLDAVINLKADKVNVNAWMGTSGDSASSSASNSGPFIVPDNLDILMNTQVSQVKYDNLTIDNMTGSLHIADQTVKLENIKGNALDGTLSVSGSYSTRDNKKMPAISLQYDVKDLDVQKTFLAFNTVQKLMPVGKYLGGKLSSKLSVTGKLGENMMPELSTLTGNGNILLIEGLLQKFKPLEILGEKLHLSEFKDISLREVREQFEFANGKVFVKPFNLKVKNIEMEIGGMHGFDQSLDYTIHLKAPRELMGKGNQAINDLVSKAANRGVPVKLSETINLNIQMLGTITSPDLRINLKETAASVADEIKDQARQIVTAKIDSAKKAVNDTLQSLKKEAVKEVSERLKAELFKKKDTASVNDPAKTKAVDPKTRAKESAKGLIENLNPFKKKKVDSVK